MYEWFEPKRKADPFRLAFFMVLSFLIHTTLRAEEPPVDGQVYFSKDDPNWPAAQQAIEAAVREYPRLKFALISIDTPEGYQALKAAEKNSEIKTPGEITLVLGPFTLINKGDSRQIELYLKPLARRALDPTSDKGRLPGAPLPFAKKIWGVEVQIEPIAPKPEDEFYFFTILQNKEIIGWVVDAFRPTRCPICGDNQFLVAVSSKDLSIQGLEPVRALERWGVALKDEEVKAFVAKFIGQKRSDKPLKVDGISGATKTSQYYQSMLNEILDALVQRKSSK